MMFRKSCTSLRDFSFGGAPEVCQEFWLVRKWIPGLLLIANVWSTGWGQALTLNGIELGMTQEQVRALHGKPDLQGSDTWSYCYSPGATWPSIQTQVTFDAQGRVCAVQGSTLESENHRYSTNSLAEIQQRWPGLHLAVDQNRRFHLSRESEVRESDPDRLRVQLGPYHPAVWLALLERLPGKADFVASVRELNGIILKGPDPLSRPPEGTKYRDEILENLALPHGRKGFRSRYIDAEGKTDSIYEITPQGDLLRLKAIKSNGVVHFKPPVLGLPNLDKTKKWSSTSSATFYAPEYPKGYALKTADRSGRVVGSETVTVPAGTFRCLKVETVIVGLPCTEWYARGVGMVKMKAGPEEYLLLRYRTK